ncbi:MAG: hypothetical protein DRQ43_10120 [Gammaproteobacteria bacterium]|nr:MAG: hypothetical protein DRQ43_10120 [Gammaproteobacteria bacterium]
MLNSAEQPTTLASTASIVFHALKAYGLDYNAILAEVGLNVDSFDASSPRIPTVKLARLWALSVDYSDDPCFGLTCAAYIQPSALHGLGLSWIASHTLKEGLDRLIRFQRILATNMTIKLRETKMGYCLYNAEDSDKNSLVFPDARYDAQIASIYKICQIMLGPDIIPSRVSFEHSRADCSSRMDDFFGITVDFDANETAIEFDKVVCEQPVSFSCPELTRINDQLVVDYLNQFDKDDVLRQTRQIIIDHLPSGVPKQAAVAQSLNLSLRSFQRKLQQLGSSYAELLDELRYDMACSYLQSPQHQIIEIAYLLGYSDPSNFARAFKRWDGVTPNAFRHKLDSVAL